MKFWGNESEDENYIFLDKEGQASKRHEIYVRCDLHPPVELLVICDALDSLSFMQSLILDNLQKIESLKGLNNIEIKNLSRSGEVLPSEGTVKDHIKPTDHLTCEVLTREIWINLQIDCIESEQSVTCQMKAARNLPIYALLKPIIAVANEYVFNSYNIRAEVDNLVLFKVSNSRIKDLKREEFDLNSTVNEYFAHTPYKILAEVDCVPNRTLSVSSESTVDGPMYLPIRKGKIMPKNEDGHNEGPNNSCCACLLF